MTRRLLVIDDEDDILEIARVALERVGGWDVITAQSAAAGVAAAANEAVDAILLDVSMPGLDGMAAARLLRDQEQSSRVPIILLTATPSVHPAAELGITGTLRKPFDPMRLSAEISELLQW